MKEGQEKVTNQIVQSTTQLSYTIYQKNNVLTEVKYGNQKEN